MRKNNKEEGVNKGKKDLMMKKNQRSARVWRK